MSITGKNRTMEQWEDVLTIHQAQDNTASMVKDVFRRIILNLFVGTFIHVYNAFLKIILTPSFLLLHSSHSLGSPSSFH